jgi:transketolase
MTKTEKMAVNAVRILSAEGVQKANSGHPGLPMGSADMAYALWAKIMKHSPKNSKWFDRDRFILSAGHGSMLIYSLLHLFDYGLTKEDLMNFRQINSKTPGHPEYGHTNGVETTTGPLGQGFANAVGMAMAEAHLAARFNKSDINIIDHYTYAISGDGCLMEGITSEAASLAGHLGLGKLIVMYDSNRITIEGSTDIAFTEDVEARFKAYNWQTLVVEDGNNMDDVTEALLKAKQEKQKPTLIICKTQIGFGCPEKQGKASAHGEPLGSEQLACTKENLNWNCPEFEVPQEVTDYQNELIEKLNSNVDMWNEKMNHYKDRYPEDAKKLESFIKGEIAELDIKELLSFDDKAIASRASSGITLNKLADKIDNLIGGSADLAPSNKSNMKDKGDFQKDSYDGRNLHFGVREHAMGAIGNGMALHGGLKAYVSTFFVFTDYMKSSMRLSALMKLPVIYVMTHDSIGVGEDGPTHQPVEHLSALRGIPGMTVIRPCDARETAAAWIHAIKSTDSPTTLVLTRQNLPPIEGTGMDALKGAYIIKKEAKDNIDLIIIATGSEVSISIDAAKKLEEEGKSVRVVSMPSMELFEKQSKEYIESVLPDKIRRRIGVEAGLDMGWYKYIGLDGKVVSINEFGISGPANAVFEIMGITTDNIIKKAKEII